MKKYYILLFSIFLALIIIFNCEIDHGLYPIDYNITGNVIFFKGKAPANTDRVEVFALKEFPPKDPQNFLYLGRSGPLDFSMGDTIAYEISISRTSYQFIGVLWKEKGKNWDFTGLLGFYTGGLQSILPDTVTVSKENPIADSTDIYANWETVSKDASISGKIIYEGKKPGDPQFLLLAIYRLKPTSNEKFFLFENVDYSKSIPDDTSAIVTSSYRLSVNSGLYNYVVLYWVGKNFSQIEDLIELGFYESPENPGHPGSVKVDSGDEAKNINIHVNFDNIEFP